MLIGCAGSDDGPADSDPKCQINTPSEKSPGYPYNLVKFKSDVVPVLTASCLGSGCHASPTGQGNFTVWADAAQGNACDINQTFNSTIAKIDLTAPNNSKLIAVVTGGDPAHPKTFQVNVASDKASLDKLTAFITDAKTTQDAGGGGTDTAGPGASPFDYTVFKTQVQPAISTAGCAVTGCHLTGAGGFTLKANPTADADLVSNFKAITSRTSFNPPESSTIYTRATIAHNGGTSTQVSSAGAGALLAWITAAKAANGGGNGGVAAGCAPAASFNQGVFTSEILPIISGAVDLNEANGVGRGPGCQSTQCHGTDRGPGKLSMPQGGDPASLLASFACFANLTAPSASDILTCPLNQQCIAHPNHPGQNVFRDGADLNYQRFLAFIYGAKAAVSPHDFAFFARKINPIFDDPNSVLGAAQGFTCASANGCHGVQVAGQAPPNGSDFPMLTAASDSSSLAFNFVSATGFVSFLNPRDSSLFQYPTDEIVKKTGADHPGGLDFDVNSQQAQDILTFATGLRPDGNGFVRNWLVLGDFAANLITDNVLFNEGTITPKIFDRDGGQFNGGAWEGFFSNSQNIDLNTQFPGAQGQTRAAYATAYILNTNAAPINVQLVTNTNNAIRVFVDGQLRQQLDNGGTSQVFVPLAGAGATPGGALKSSARIMIKLLQRAQDAQFAFQSQVTDENGLVLTNVNSGLVFTLGPDGGI